ncbi:MAG: GAF domain-containing SpoIIE family protein phosphatase [Coriobacteriia bacterium]
MARVQRGDSLASNMAVLTLMAVAIAVTVISLAALGGVFDLATNQAVIRHTAYRQAVHSQVASRLDAARRVLDRVGSSLEMDTPAIDYAQVASQYEAGIEYVDRLVLARPDGSVVTAQPVRVRASVVGQPYFEPDIPAGISYVYVPETRELWVRRTSNGPQGRIIVLARMRTPFLQELLDGFSSGDSDRVAFVSQGDRTPFAVGQAGVELSDIVYVEDSPGQGSATALDAAGERYSGRYQDLVGYPGLDWRVSVIGPRSRIMAATRDALTPAVVALTVTALLTIVIVTLFARRLVAPLRDLETHARTVAAGSYLPPIESHRTDEVGRLAEAFNEMSLRLNALHDVSRLLASTTDSTEVLDRIIEALRHIAGSAGVAIFLVDDVGRALCLERATGVETPLGLCVPLTSKSWLVSALDSVGPASFMGSEAEFASAIAGLAAPGERAGLTAPLRSGGEGIGVIVIIPRGRQDFTDAEIEMMRTYSAQASAAVNISRLFAEESAARRDAEVMREVAETLSSPRDVEQALTTVMDTVTEVLGLQSARVEFIDRSSLGLGPSQDPMGERPLLRAWGVAWAAGDGDSLLRVSRGEDPAVDGFLDESAAREVLFLTVMRGEEPSVVVAFLIGQDGHTFTPQELTLIDGMGTEIGLAVDNAFHYAQAESRAANLETIFRISQAVSSSLQIKVVLNRVLDVVQKIFTADAVSLMQYDEGKRLITTAMARGIISAEMLHFECEPGSDIPGRVFGSGEPVKIDDIVDEDSLFAAAAYRQGMRSLLSVPLLARGRSLGVLTVFAMDELAFSEEDRGLLHTFASQAALAIDTAAMYGREHHVSTVLQESILPRSLPEYDEVEASSVYLAASQEAGIGGDYFDMFKAPDGTIVIAMGDVCGKGVTAATKTSMIKYAIRGLVAAGLGPGRAMEEVNAMVSESGDTADIVTLWLGMLDAEGGVLRHANGGHPPGLLLHDDGTCVVRLETTGPLLGAIPDAEYDEVLTCVLSGDVLITYTDGVTEARRGNKFFGEGRVRRALTQGGSAAETVDRLLASLDRFVPGNLRDDAAVLAVRLKPGKELRADR